MTELIIKVVVSCHDCMKPLGSNPASCHECAMVASARPEEQEWASLPDNEERRLKEDNTASIIAHDIVCECGSQNFCPIHDEA